MKKIQVREATNTQLDWLVAIASGWTDVQITAYEDPACPEECFFRPSKVVDGIEICGGGIRWRPTTNPAQMWPIIEQEFISTSPGDWDVGSVPVVKNWTAWSLSSEIHGDEPFCYGPTALVAAARCFITSKLGDTVEVPKILG